MVYKTEIVEYSPKMNNMAQKIEEKANEMFQQGYELVTVSMGIGSAIAVFKNTNVK